MVGGRDDRRRRDECNDYDQWWFMISMINADMMMDDGISQWYDQYDRSRARCR